MTMTDDLAAEAMARVAREELYGAGLPVTLEPAEIARIHNALHRAARFAEDLTDRREFKLAQEALSVAAQIRPALDLMGRLSAVSRGQRPAG